jgi:DNA-binding response OmpR family regulator
MNENVGSESPAVVPERPVVLVADDEPSMLELVSQHLKTMHEPTLEVVEASDGEQAWKLAQEFLPDLVVLDVMMPGMSGWEVCRKIREDVALAHTAVVMLTGIGENLNQMTSPLYGADGYLDKPFEFEELDEKVREALAARAQQRGGIQRPKTNGVHHVDESDDDDASIPPDEDTADDLERAAKLADAAPKRAPAKKKSAAAKKAAPAKKPTAKKKTAAKKTPAKKTPATKKTAAKKSPAKKAAPAKKKTAAKKAPAKKGAASKAPAKKQPAAPKKKAAPAAKKKTAKKKSRR